MTPKPDRIWLTAPGPIAKALPTPSPGSRTPDISLTGGHASKIRIAAQLHVRPTCQRDDLWVHQGGEFVGVAISLGTVFKAAARRRMQVDFGQTATQMTNKPAKPRRRHRAGPSKAEHAIRGAQSSAADAPGQQLCPGCDVSRKSTSTRLHCGQDSSRLVRHAQGAHAMASADRNDLVGDQRMQVKVLVSIDVIE